MLKYIISIILTLGLYACSDMQDTSVYETDIETELEYSLSNNPQEWVGATCGETISICDGLFWVYCDEASNQYKIEHCPRCLDCCTVSVCSNDTGCSIVQVPIGSMCFPGGYCTLDGACLQTEQWEGLSCNVETDNYLCMMGSIDTWISYIATCNTSTSVWDLEVCTDCLVCPNSLDAPVL